MEERDFLLHASLEGLPLLLYIWPLWGHFVFLPYYISSAPPPPTELTTYYHSRDGDNLTSL